MPDPEIEDAIRGVAARHGIDPSLMMAIADRESSFNPRGGSGSPYSSAYGLFQLLRSERAKYGGNSTDPTEQAEAWANYIRPTQNEMANVLGREPTGPETYLGHYVGGSRAARMLTSMHADTPVEAVFTPTELAANPNIRRAGTVGAFSSSVLADIARRQQKFGGEGDFSQSAQPDFSEHAQNAGSAAKSAPQPNLSAYASPPPSPTPATPPPTEELPTVASPSFTTAQAPQATTEPEPQLQPDPMAVRRDFARQVAAFAARGGSGGDAASQPPDFSQYAKASGRPAGTPMDQTSARPPGTPLPAL